MKIVKFFFQIVIFILVYQLTKKVKGDQNLAKKSNHKSIKTFPSGLSITNSSTTKPSYSLETPTNMQAELGRIDTLLNGEIEPSQSQLLWSKSSARNDYSSEIQVNKTLIKIAKNALFIIL